MQHPKLYKHVFVQFDQYFKLHHEYHQHVQQRPISRTATIPMVAQNNVGDGEMFKESVQF